MIEWNPAAEMTFGFPRAQVLGQRLSDLIIPEPMRAAHRRRMAHFLATGRRRRPQPAHRDPRPPRKTAPSSRRNCPPCRSGWMAASCSPRMSATSPSARRRRRPSSAPTPSSGPSRRPPLTASWSWTSSSVSSTATAASANCGASRMSLPLRATKTRSSPALAQMQDLCEFLRQIEHLYACPQEHGHGELHLKDGRVFDRYSAPVTGEDGLPLRARLVLPRRHRRQENGGGAARGARRTGDARPRADDAARAGRGGLPQPL